MYLSIYSIYHIIMNFPKNHNSVKKLVVDDQLHIAAIDFTFLELAPSDMVDIKGIMRKNNRWVLINGTHNINYGHDNNKPCYIHATRDKDTYVLDFCGTEPVKTIHKILGAKRIKITNETFIREIDMLIMKEKNMGVNGGFVADVVPFPMNDIYTFNKQDQKGYMILNKESKDDEDSYTIDIVGDYYNKIVDDILNSNGVRVVNYGVANETIFVRVIDKMPLQDIFPSQQIIIDYAIDAYTASKTKNATILISGGSGLGKSSVAFGITQILKRRLGVDPYLIKGFNVNSEEMQYHPIINHYSPKRESPVILLLDEFDIALKNANLPESSDNNAHAISANKTNMNNFLDAINDEQYLITVATTNMSLAEINNQFGVYCRKGRFNKHFEYKSKDVVNSVDPN